ncbi:MAG: tRNA-binding protein [Parafilimonas sp.]
MISREDFEKIEMRCGTVIDVKNFANAKKPAYQLTIDFGEYGIKKTSAQITVHYSQQQLLNKQVIAVINFPVKQIANFFSECLVLGVYDENNNVVLLQPQQTVKNGMRVG